jgi:hypothetical protein
MASALESHLLLKRLQRVRRRSEYLVTPLDAEDVCLQGMADASPPKWHLGHTAWFFETFLLEPHLPGWEPADRRWGLLFNSYYDAIGPRHPRPQRGLLTRPTMAEVLRWRHRIDAGLETLLAALEQRPAAEAERYPPSSPKRTLSSKRLASSPRPRSARAPAIAVARTPSPAHPWRHSTPYTPRPRG